MSTHFDTNAECITPENAEGTVYTRSRYEPKLDCTGCYRVGDRAYVHSEVVRSMVSGLAERVIATDKQTFDAEAEAHAKMFSAGIVSARKRVSDGAFSRHFVAAMIAVGHRLHLSRVTGIAPSAEHVADRFVAEIDALERGAEAEPSQEIIEPENTDGDKKKKKPQVPAFMAGCMLNVDGYPYQNVHNVIWALKRRAA